MKKILLLALTPFLAGCLSTPKPNLISVEYKVVKAPDDLYNCPIETRFPKSDTLTNQQVGALILKLQKNNVACKNSMNALKKFYDDAEQTVSNTSKVSR